MTGCGGMPCWTVKIILDTTAVLSVVRCVQVAPRPTPHPCPTSAARPFLRFEDSTWTFAEVLDESARYARAFLARRDPARPFHVGLLLENRPEFVFAELGAGLCGAARRHT